MGRISAGRQIIRPEKNQISSIPELHDFSLIFGGLLELYLSVRLEPCILTAMMMELSSVSSDLNNTRRASVSEHSLKQSQSVVGLNINNVQCTTYIIPMYSERQQI